MWWTWNGTTLSCSLLWSQKNKGASPSSPIRQNINTSVWYTTNLATMTVHSSICFIISSLEFTPFLNKCGFLLQELLLCCESLSSQLKFIPRSPISLGSRMFIDSFHESFYTFQPSWLSSNVVLEAIIKLHKFEFLCPDYFILPFLLQS